MAYTFVAEGAPAWDSNVAVTPALPSGLQVGDLMVCAGFIKENGATLGISSTSGAWTLIETYASGAAELRWSVWYKYYASGEVAPTITPTGGGSGDVVFACIQAIRGGTHQSITVRYGTEGSASDKTQVDLWPLAGDAMFMFAVMNNDNGGTVPSTYSIHSDTPGTWIYTGFGQITGGETLLGSDGFALLSCQIAGLDCEYADDFLPKYTFVTPSLLVGQYFASMGFWVHPQPSATTFTYVASGGNKDGGVSVTAYEQASLGDYTADGGEVSGGSAVTAIFPWGVAVATGGEISGGVAGCQFTPQGFVGVAERVVVAVNGIPKNATLITIRHTADELKIDLVLVGNGLIAAGSIVSINAAYTSQYGVREYISASGVVDWSSVSGGFVTLGASGIPSLGAGDYLPDKIAVAMSGRYRAPIDWRVKPGQSVFGLEVKVVVTTISSSGQAFMEVSYG